MVRFWSVLRLYSRGTVFARGSVSCRHGVCVLYSAHSRFTAGVRFMSPVVYLDGQFLPKEEAKISVFDHGFLYGDGVFEGIRAYSGRVFRLDEHVERLYRSAKAIMLEIPHTQSEMRELVLETCRRNDLSNGYIRVVVSRGPGDLGIAPRNCK